MAGQGQKISGPDTKPEPECELCKTKIYYYVIVTYGHICCKAKAQSCTFQLDIVPVSDEEQPLYLPYIERPDGRTAPFVAGRNGGLTIINVINIEK